MEGKTMEIKTLAALKRIIQPGVRLRCIENTYRPDLNGKDRTVTRVQTNGFYWRPDEWAKRDSWTPYPKANLFTFEGDTFKFSLGTATNDFVRLEILTTAL